MCSCHASDHNHCLGDEGGQQAAAHTQVLCIAGWLMRHCQQNTRYFAVLQQGRTCCLVFLLHVVLLLHLLVVRSLLLL